MMFWGRLAARGWLRSGISSSCNHNFLYWNLSAAFCTYGGEDGQNSHRVMIFDRDLKRNQVRPIIINIQWYWKMHFLWVLCVFRCFCRETERHGWRRMVKIRSSTLLPKICWIDLRYTSKIPFFIIWLVSIVLIIVLRYNKKNIGLLSLQSGTLNYYFLIVLVSCHPELSMSGNGVIYVAIVLSYINPWSFGLHNSVSYNLQSYKKFLD